MPGPISNAGCAWIMEGFPSPFKIALPIPLPQMVPGDEFESWRQTIQSSVRRRQIPSEYFGLQLILPESLQDIPGTVEAVTVALELLGIIRTRTRMRRLLVEISGNPYFRPRCDALLWDFPCHQSKTQVAA